MENGPQNTQTETLSSEEWQRLAEAVRRPSILNHIRDWTRGELKEAVDSGRILLIRNCGRKARADICAAMGWDSCEIRKRRARVIKDFVAPQELLSKLQNEHFRLYAGVYLLFRNDQVKYVGQSLNVISRLGAHVGIKPFDSVKTICLREWSVDNPIPVDEIASVQTTLLSWEAALIQHFKPEWNG